MLRKIIQIDEEKCNGCGACAAACHEGAIGMANGKAWLLRDDYCDGLGDCLPACPAGAIAFVEREAAPYDGNAVKAAQQKRKSSCGCPGTEAKQMERKQESSSISEAGSENSRLSQWPVQIRLIPVNAPYFDGAHLLVAADCTAYAYGNFHNRFMRDRITLIGCPKLDHVDYAEKLATVIRENDIKSVTVVRMEVPCCGGLEYAVKTAIQASGKAVLWKVETVSMDGQILDRKA